MLRARFAPRFTGRYRLAARGFLGGSGPGGAGGTRLRAGARAADSGRLWAFLGNSLPVIKALLFESLISSESAGEWPPKHVSGELPPSRTRVATVSGEAPATGTDGPSGARRTFPARLAGLRARYGRGSDPDGA